MINATSILPVIVLAMLSGYSVADDLSGATEGLCDTIRSCALEAVAGQDLTDELQASIAPMVAGHCATMSSLVQTVPAGDKLYQPAVGCLRSMESLSCEQLRTVRRVKTPECTEYDRLASEAHTAE